MFAICELCAEMAEAMKNLVENCLDQNNSPPGAKGDELTVEERNLLSVAYKNAVGARRASWRIISSVEQKEANRNHMANKALAASYRQKVENELNKICQEILTLLTDKLLPRTTVSLGCVLYASRVPGFEVKAVIRGEPWWLTL